MTPGNIVIRGPNWVGDAVLGVPAMKAVRERFPKARITLLVRPWVAGLFSSAPFIDEVWTLSGTKTAGWLQAARQMRQRQFDVALLLPNSFEAAWSVFLGGVRERVGYATDHRSWLLNRPVRLPEGKPHQVDYYLHLVHDAFGPGPRPDIAIHATDGESAAAARLLSENGVDPARGYAVINAGAAFGSAKRWMEDRFAGVGDYLSRELGLQVVLIGSAGEGPIAEAIQSYMQSGSTVLNGQTDLETLVGILGGAAITITNDSGPMHMSAALGVPTVAVFGSTDATVTSPVGPRTRLVRQDVECSPCMLRECPIDHRCMTAVTVDDVCRAARALVGRP
jgi:heptosyltransferase-2